MGINDRRAVLLGVTGTSGGFDPLPGVQYDIKAMTLALEHHRDGTTPNFEVQAETVDEMTPWTVGSLLETIEIELSSAKHFLFYFSGHGDVTPFGLQLITPDRNREAGSGEHYDSGIYFDVLLHRFNAAHPDTEVTVILDCCYAGAAGDAPTPGDDILQRFTHLRDGISIVASSGRELPSFGEDDSGSDFTEAVVQCLEFKQPHTDILDIYKWAKREVAAQAPVLRTFGSRHSSIRADDSEAASEIP